MGRADTSTRNPRVRWWMAACLGGALALTGCSSGHAGSSTTSSTTTPPVRVASGATGCQAPSAASTTLTISVAGHPRTVIIHVPAGHSGTSKVPLVLNMHGSGSTALEQEGLTGMDGTADADGFIVAYPQGVLPEGSGFDWNVPGVPLVGGKAVPAGAADDVAFLTQLVGKLQARYCIDSARIYATGFSGGARMASQLACDSSTTFAAVAPVSGLRDSDALSIRTAGSGRRLPRRSRSGRSVRRSWPALLDLFGAPGRPGLGTPERLFTDRRHHHRRRPSHPHHL